MDIRIRINDENYLVRDVADASSFSYIDNDDALCMIDITEESFSLLRRAPEHITRLVLGEEKTLEMISGEGSFSFYPKDIEIRKNNDIISIVYTVEGDLKSIEIEYIGD